MSYYHITETKPVLQAEVRFKTRPAGLRLDHLYILTSQSLSVLRHLESRSTGISSEPRRRVIIRAKRVLRRQVSTGFRAVLLCGLSCLLVLEELVSGLHWSQ